MTSPAPTAWETATDETLLLFLKQEKGVVYDAAFDTLMARYAGSFYQLARYHLHLQHEDAEEVANDTLMRVVDRVDTYREGENARAWLQAICRHLIIDRMRKLQRSRHIKPLEEWSELEMEVPDDSVERWVFWVIEQRSYDEQQFWRAYGEVCKRVSDEDLMLFENGMGRGEWRAYRKAEQRALHLFQACYADTHIQEEAN